MFVVPAKLKLTLPNLDAPYIAGTNLACHTISHHAASHRNVPKLACLTKTCQTPTQHNGPPHTLPAVTYLDAPRLANPVQDIPQLPYTTIPKSNETNLNITSRACLAESHLTATRLTAPELACLTRLPLRGTCRSCRLSLAAIHRYLRYIRQH